MNRNILFFVSVLVIGLLSSFNSLQASAGQGISYYKAGFPQVAKPLLIAEIASDTATRAETCFYLGNIYFGENKVDSAEICFKKGMIEKQPNVLNTIGLAMLKVKSNPKIAEQDIQNVLKLPASKKNINFIIAAAYAYLFNGKNDQASIYLEKARSIKSKSAAVAVLAGDIELTKPNNVGKACENYDLAIYYDEKCKEAYIKYARAYKTVNPNLAIDKLNVLKSKDPSFLLVDRELADIYYAVNDFDKAAKLYDNYLKSGNSNVQDLTKYAMTVFLNKDYAKSLEIAKLGLVKAPRNPAFNRLAMYDNVALENYDEAIKYADLFFNKSENPDISYFDYTYYGQALRQTKKYDLAIEQFKNALKFDSTQIGFWKDISDMYVEKNDYPNAISNYQIFIKSLSEDKKTSEVLITLAKLYYNYGNAETTTDAAIKKNAFIKADSVFTKVAVLEPTGYRAILWRARTNFALNPDNGSAKPYYEQTLLIVEPKVDVRYNPVIVECSRFLGFYYFLKKDYNQSKVYWNKILAIEPKNDIALKAIEGIDKTLKGNKK